jgi:hypothetical protein
MSFTAAAPPLSPGQTGQFLGTTPSVVPRISTGHLPYAGASGGVRAG